MPGMKSNQEDHLRFVLNRAYNTVSEVYHREQEKRDSWDNGKGIAETSATLLLDAAIDKLAEQLILLVTARVKVGAMERGEPSGG